MTHDPQLHSRPASGWLNDPNGIGHWDGRWHLMFQWNPNAPVHTDIHWGHLSSTDLLRWRDEGVALRPRPGGIDAGGAWSGVATIDDGRPVLAYTAITSSPRDSGVALARQGEDGRFVQSDHWVEPHPDGWEHVRDPFFLTIDGRRYALQGAGRPDGTGAVLGYRVDDLDGPWRLLGEIASAEDVPPGVRAEGFAWECPQLVLVGSTWVLVVSSLGERGPQSVTAYTGTVTASESELTFHIQGGGPLDHGPDFYAPQLVVDGERVLAWAWSWEGRGDGTNQSSAPADQDWAGTLTFPRELVADDGTARLVPARELIGLRGDPLPVADGLLETDEISWSAETTGGFELVLAGPGGVRPVWGQDDAALLLVDGSILEAFDSHGSRTQRVYRNPGERWSLRSPAGTLTAWTLRLP